MIKRPVFPLFFTLLLGGLALQGLAYSSHVPFGRILPSLLWPSSEAFGEIYLHHSLLPRLLVALLAGAALSLSGAVFQQVLRNPLAEPATLGLLSGAQLGIMLASLQVTALTMWQREAAGLAGAFVALALVTLLASRRGFSPVTMLLSGLIVSFFAGTTSVVLALFNHDYLRSVFIWASGSLVQNDFSNATALTWRLAVLVPLLLLLRRPLTIAGLDDTSGRSLGVPVGALRLVSLSLASILAAVVVARVGVIAFVGLAAPHLATLAGVRTFAGRLIWAPLLGAALLLLTDGAVLALSRSVAEVPTGTATAFAGALLLLVLLRRMPAGTSPVAPHAPSSPARPWRIGVSAVVVMTLVCVAAFSLTERLFIESLPMSELFAGRWPRLLAAVCSGGMLALAGAIMQAVTGNPLASPEGLGVSSGAGLGIVAAIFLAGSFSPVVLLAGGVTGALLTFFAILAITRRSDHAPGPVLLAGVAIGTFAAALISLILASGDPRAVYVLAWTMGPTFRATALTGLVALAVLSLFLVLLPLFSRWLEILPLGDAAARGLGVSPSRSRGALLSVAAILTATATLIVGPLSFVGLIAPHIAMALVPGRPLLRAVCACAIGAMLMAAADWLGRSIHFPYEIPAGVLASFVGGPYFLWLLYRRAP